MLPHKSLLRCAGCELDCQHQDESVLLSIAAHTGCDAELSGCPRESSENPLEVVRFNRHRAFNTLFHKVASV